MRLKEVNKELRRINKNTNSNDKVIMNEDLDEVKSQLSNREKEFKVFGLCHYLFISSFFENDRTCCVDKMFLKRATEDN